MAPTPEMRQALRDRGLNARVETLEELINGLVEYATALHSHYAGRVERLEENAHGVGRPSPSFPTFTEWYQQYHDRISKADARQYTGEPVRRDTGGTLGGGALGGNYGG